MPTTDSSEVKKSASKLRLIKTVPFSDLVEKLRQIEFRGVYDTNGNPLKPYKDASLTLRSVKPPQTIALPPLVAGSATEQPLFTPQPTIYTNQTQIMEILDVFLQREGLDITNLQEAVEYYWPDRGVFHIMPPIIERHTYRLSGGYIDLEALSKRFLGAYIKDATGQLHDLSLRHLEDFYIDEVSKLRHLDVFNSNAPLINYGLQYTGDWSCSIICDGTHRIDYAIEVKGKPITVVAVESEDVPLLPYYAFPVSFRPTIRLSSKRAEVMYPRLERDKIHLLNDLISKVLHYDWTNSELNVSSLRSKKDIF